MNNIFKSDVILFTNKKENILYFLNKDYKGYSFHKDSEKTFSKIKEIKHIFFLKKKSLIYKSEYFFIEKEKDMILDYFKDVEIKEKIKFLMKKNYYQFLYITQENTRDDIFLNMLDKETHEKIRYRVPENGEFIEIEWKEENINEVSFSKKK